MMRPAAVVLFAWMAGALVALGAPKAEVFYAMDTSAIGSLRVVNASTVRRMVDGLVCAVTGQGTVRAAWRQLVSPADRVGIKVAASGRGVSGTNPEVVQAIAEGLIAAGIAAENIIVWDRDLDDLKAAGFRTDGKYYQLEAVASPDGYDLQAQVSAPVLGKLIWGDRKFGDRRGSRLADLLDSGDQLSSQSYFASLLSRRVTRVINVPSLTDSYLTGINGALVNMTLPNLDNWRRFAKSAAAGDSYIAELYADAMIHEKVVLTILDGLILQYAGGPFPNPEFSIENLTLFASRDPVAIDATALRLVDEVRKAHKLPSAKPMAAYIDAAAQLGLGQAQESQIERIRIGVDAAR